MVWFQRKVAVDPRTNKQMYVYLPTTEFNLSLYPSLWFDHFKDVQVFTTFQLLFHPLESDEEEEKIQIIDMGQLGGLDGFGK
jgi:hypothetical protein